MRPDEWKATELKLSNVVPVQAAATRAAAMLNPIQSCVHGKLFRSVLLSERFSSAI